MSPDFPTVENWLRALKDPVYFADAFLGVQLHDGQKRWLQNSTARENLLVTGNRWGKSFASAVKLIHHAIFRTRPLKFDYAGRYRAIVASITQDQADIVFNTTLRLLRQAELLESLIEDVVHSPYPKITFGNEATIEARSTQHRGEYLLGNDYDLFIFDEVAFEMHPEYVVEEVIMMRLADREGKLDLISTPNGKNWFYRRANDLSDGKRPGYFQSGDSRENTYISRDYLDERVQYFTESRLKQNIMGQFVDSGGEVLKGEYIDRALALAPIQPPLNLSSDPLPDSLLSSSLSSLQTPSDSSSSLSPSLQLITGWDLARKRTATVGITIAVIGATARVIALERLKQHDWAVVIEHIKRRQYQFPGQLVIDATGLGDVIVEQLREFNPTPVIFTPTTKAELLTNVELFHARGNVCYDRWQLPDGPGKVWSLEDELRQARWDDNNECDSLMALALALWPLRRPPISIIEPRLGKV